MDEQQDAKADGEDLPAPAFQHAVGLDAAAALRYPDDWPDNCPPDDAAPMNRPLYRVTKKPDIVTARDLKSHREKGRRLGKACPCKHAGISVFDTLENARHMMAVIPRIGNHVAVGELNAAHGRYKRTNINSPGHHTWWAPVSLTPEARAALFRCVE